jgi:hypothetical protein
MTLMFWLGTPFFGVMASLSTSVFFLTWDRCLTLIAPARYNRRQREWFVQACVLSQLMVAMCMVVWLNSDRPPLGLMTGTCRYHFINVLLYLFTDCMSYGCVGPTLSPKVTNMKLFFAATNIISAFVFALLFLKFSRKEPMSCPINSRKVCY